MPKSQGRPLTVALAAMKIFGEKTDRTTRAVLRLIDRGIFPGAYVADPSAKRSFHLIPETEVDAYLATRKKRGQTVEV